MSRPSFSEEVWNGLGDAISDIRMKVVEEPMYGRAVTEGGEFAEWPQAREQEQSFGSRQQTREMEPEQSPDMDR